jgi:phage protein D
MFDYISVSFPQTDLQPVTVYSAYIYQERYKHEIAVLTFKDWGVLYESIEPGSPVQITTKSTGLSREFFGYIHHVTPNRTPGKDYVEVTVIGASYSMKKPSQTIYRDVTADVVVKKIAKSHGFVCYAVPHPRVYEQIAQAGHTDWEFMIRLAKQSGYSLRAENTELYFQPLLEDYSKYRGEAPILTMGDVGSIDGTSMYSFTPLIGESIPYGNEQKAAVAITGVDRFNKTAVKTTNQKRLKKTKLKFQPEFFDRFETSVVATDSQIANYEATAADNINSTFPYRARVEVIGDVKLRPDLPVYLTGLGATYSGYWTILNTEHCIVETQRNVYTYTTFLEIGTDSLGSGTDWIDNKNISAPRANPARTIIPNVRQTKVKPTTQLLKRSVAPSPQLKGSFGTLNNRTKPAAGSVKVTPPVWRSTTTSLESIVPEVRKPSYVVSRLQRKGEL